MFRIIFMIFLLFTFIFAQDVAIVKKVSGEVFAKRLKDIEKLSMGSKIQEKDIIITKTSSNIGLIFEDGTIVSLGENSVLSINKYIFRPSQKEFMFDVDMSKGLVTFESGKIGKLAPEAVKFRIPEGTIGIRGTKFYVEVK